MQCSNNNYIKTIIIGRAMYGSLQSATGRNFRKDKKMHIKQQQEMKNKQTERT